jgi:hypothetical protein
VVQDRKSIYRILINYILDPKTMSFIPVQIGYNNIINNKLKRQSNEFISMKNGIKI